MSMIEILDELPKLLAAIDEADAASPRDDLSIEDVSKRVTQWAHSK